MAEVVDAAGAADRAAGLRLTLYSRQYCHLCHEMAAMVEAIRADVPFDLDVLDVDADPALEARFNELVPVLMHGERELARYRLDAGGLRAYLAAIPAHPPHTKG